MGRLETIQHPTNDLLIYWLFKDLHEAVGAGETLVNYQVDLSGQLEPEGIGLPSKSYKAFLFIPDGRPASLFYGATSILLILITFMAFIGSDYFPVG